MPFGWHDVGVWGVLRDFEPFEPKARRVMQFTTSATSICGYTKRCVLKYGFKSHLPKLILRAVEATSVALIECLISRTQSRDFLHV